MRWTKKARRIDGGADAWERVATRRRRGMEGMNGGSGDVDKESGRM